MSSINSVYNNLFKYCLQEGWQSLSKQSQIVTAITLIATAGAAYFYYASRTMHRITLGESFEHITLQKIDTRTKVEFHDFLRPNEGHPFAVKEHLDLMEQPGLIVSTGTERSFFDLALCNPEKCLGLVVRDINPKVKAYVDFNTMLLRISSDMNEYAALSSDLKLGIGALGDFTERIKIIQEKLQKSDIPEHTRNYYLENLEEFGKIYLLQPKNWREKAAPLFEGVQYHKDLRLFTILQSFAKSGKIIATVGDINDLHFLDGQSIAIVDISNIPDYIIMDLKGDKNFHPRIIWTKPNGLTTLYYFFIHQAISQSKKEEMKQLIPKLRKFGIIGRNDEKLSMDINRLLFPNFVKKSEKHEIHCGDYSSRS